MSMVSYSSLTNCYDTIEKIIVVAPHANVKFALNNDSQCFKFNRFVVQNNSTVQFGSMRYNWQFGDNTKDSSSLTRMLSSTSNTEPNACEGRSSFKGSCVMSMFMP